MNDDEIPGKILSMQIPQFCFLVAWYCQTVEELMAAIGAAKRCENCGAYSPSIRKDGSDKLFQVNVLANSGRDSNLPVFPPAPACSHRKPPFWKSGRFISLLALTPKGDTALTITNPSI